MIFAYLNYYAVHTNKENKIRLNHIITRHNKYILRMHCYLGCMYKQSVAYESGVLEIL